MPLYEATLHGSAGIAVPTLVSTLAICCVFTSVVFLEGRPSTCSRRLALLWFLLLASYGLSRTLTPIAINGRSRANTTPHLASPMQPAGLLVPAISNVASRLRQSYVRS